MTVYFSAVLVAVGDYSSKKSEKLENGVWSEIEEPPVDGWRMFNYAALFNAGSHYFFGGADGGASKVDHLDTILQLRRGYQLCRTEPTRFRYTVVTL